MFAKCPKCERRAGVNEEMSKIRCEFCDYEDTFDEYMKKMKERVGSIISDYQEKTS
ncbi:MAG: zinc-domain-containing protein [Nitrososphaerales archaeon]